MEKVALSKSTSAKLAFDRQLIIRKRVLTYSQKTEEQPYAWWRKLALSKSVCWLLCLHKTKQNETQKNKLQRSKSRARRVYRRTAAFRHASVRLTRSPSTINVSVFHAHHIWECNFAGTSMISSLQDTMTY